MDNSNYLEELKKRKMLPKEAEAFRKSVGELVKNINSLKKQEEANLAPAKKVFVYDKDTRAYILTSLKEKVHIETDYKWRFATDDEVLDIKNGKNSNIEIDSEYQIGENKWMIEEVLRRKIKEPIPNCTPADLPMGIFRATHVPVAMGRALLEYEFSTDAYIDLSSHTGAIVKDIDTFLSSEKHYKDLGLLHKRGMLLYGPPGTGKTMLLEEVARRLKDRARIIFLRGHGVEFLEPFKNMLSDAPTVVIMEEFTQYGMEGEETLSFLDGESSWDKCIFIATTNYPERIPDNLIDRPARIDSIFEVGLPDSASRAKYLAEKGIEIIDKKLIDATEGYTLAYLKELVVATKVYNKSIPNILIEFAERKDKIKKFAEENARNAKGIILRHE